MSDRSAAVPLLSRSRLLVLALGAFALGTDGFVVAGVLPAMSADLRVSPAAAGQTVTVFALVYALAAPLLAVLAARRERRGVLLAGMGAFVVANLLSAAAPGFGWLVASRVLAALAAALYAPTALGVVATLAAPAHRGRAVATVLAGMTVSLLVGVPLGGAVGNLGSWRATFVLVAALGAVAVTGIAALFPRVAPAPASSVGERLRLLARPEVLGTIAAMALWMTGGFTVFTYAGPLLTRLTGWNGAAVSVLLVAYGAAAMLGNAAGGRSTDRHGAERTLLVGLLALVAAFGGLTLALHVSRPAAIGLVLAGLALWGAGGWMLPAAQMHRLVAVRPSAASELASLNSLATYLGIALGAALGGAVLAHASITAVPAAGMLLEVLGLAWLIGGTAWAARRRAVDCRVATAGALCLAGSDR